MRFDWTEATEDRLLEVVDHSEYEIYNADCVEVLRDMPENSIDFSIFSPPFASLYVYSDSTNDMGNSSDFDDEFKLHYQFFSDALYPVIKLGRIVATHIQQVARTKATHGHMGLFDIRGSIIRIMEDSGFIYYGETMIPKNPQAVSIRTKSHKLAFQSLEKDQTLLAPVNCDFLMLFKKPGENRVPVRTDVTRDEWIRLAEGYWDFVGETNTLNVNSARSEKDERHVCPLQLDLIRQAIRLWSNEGETVLSPFMGIGSEGYEALQIKRRFVGVELKEQYFEVAKKNLEHALWLRDGQMEMFGGAQ
jgi:DNA modification methylase